MFRTCRSPLRPYFRPRLLALAVASLAAAPGHAATLSVNTTAPGIAIDGKCSLREALDTTNGFVSYADCPVTGALGTNDTINFNIPMSELGCVAATGVCTISPTTTLTVANPVLIDGYSQPGATPNTQPANAFPNALGLDTQIRIQIDGMGTPANTDGLSLIGFNAVVRGLAIYNYHGTGSAIRISGTSNTVAGNFIGIKADGTTSGGLNNSDRGIYAISTSNSIGGPSAAQRNLIAGHLARDVDIFGGNSNAIQGNLIGTDATGTLARSTGAIAGIQVKGNASVASGISIRNNLIAGLSNGTGIALVAASTSSVLGNTVGIAVGGGALGNQSGIEISNTGTLSGTGNNISGNGIAHSTGPSGLPGLGYGIQLYASGGAIPDPVGQRLDTNAIWGNAGLGIDLSPDGETSGTVTTNDAPAALDADSGPNGRQNFPVIASATVNGGNVDIVFALDSAASTTYAISAYANDTCDASGYGEGQYPASGTPGYTTNGSGHAGGTLSIPLATTGWAAGKWVTLLATDTSASATSEFSACVQIAGAANAPPVANPDSYATPQNQVLNVAAAGVLANDTDANGNPLTAVLASGPAHAQSFTLNANGSFSYTVAGAYTGADSFTYYANDGTANSATPATVGLTITAPPATCYTGATNGGSVTACVTGGGASCGFTASAFTPVSSVPAAPPANYSFPYDLFDFALGNCTAGATTTVTLTYPSAIPANTVYWKYGPQTAGGPSGWYAFSGAAINGNQMTLTLTDGALGDDDLTVNGIFLDAGGPGVPAAPLPVASTSPASLAFGSRAVGSASAPQTVTVGNTGGAPLVIGATAIGPLGDFTIQSNHCAATTLAPAASCSIGIVFTPAAAGARSATLSIASNDPAGNRLVPLSGNGTAIAAPGEPQAIPTLSEWGLLILSLLLGGLGFSGNSRRREIP